MPIPATAVGTALATSTAVIERGSAAILRRGDRRDRPDLHRRRRGARGGPPRPSCAADLLLRTQARRPGSLRLAGRPRHRHALRAARHAALRLPRLAFAGDEVTLRPRISDVYEKRGGALEFLTVETRRHPRRRADRHPHRDHRRPSSGAGGRAMTRPADRRGRHRVAGPRTRAGISRTTLALFAGASGDHNPIHLDIDVARSAGLDDVFAQGMLSMAYLGRLLTGWVPQERIRSFEVRFAAITPVHGTPTCTGRVVAGRRRRRSSVGPRVELAVTLADGTVTLTGRRRSSTSTPRQELTHGNPRGQGRARLGLGPRHRPRDRAQARERGRAGRRERPRRRTGERDGRRHHGGRRTGGRLHRQCHRRRLRRALRADRGRLVRRPRHHRQQRRATRGTASSRR